MARHQRDPFGNTTPIEEARKQIARQRRWAIFHWVFATARVVAWVALLAMYLLHLAFPHVAEFTAGLFASVSFVACVSLYANAVTDLGVAQAARAGVIAADSRRDAYDSGDYLLHRILGEVDHIGRRQEGE